MCILTLFFQGHVSVLVMSHLQVDYSFLEGEMWRIRMNYEMNKLIENADIIRFIKSRRIAWLGHVMRMDDKRTPKRILEWKPIGTRIRGRPRKRWIVDIEEDMQIMGKNGG